MPDPLSLVLATALSTVRRLVQACRAWARDVSVVLVLLSIGLVNVS